MQRADLLKVATFLLNAVVALAVYNVTQSIGSLKELLNTRMDYIEQRIDRHERAK